jgi:hypothetical protein
MPRAAPRSPRRSGSGARATDRRRNIPRPSGGWPRASAVSTPGERRATRNAWPPRIDLGKRRRQEPGARRALLPLRNSVGDWRRAGARLCGCRAPSKDKLRGRWKSSNAAMRSAVPRAGRRIAKPNSSARTAELEREVARLWPWEIQLPLIPEQNSHAMISTTARHPDFSHQSRDPHWAPSC